MEKVAVRSQGFIGNCYGHTAAQLVDAYRFSHGDRHWEKQTSGLMASITSSADARFFPSKTNETGKTCDAVESIRENGACDEAGTKDKYGLKADESFAAFKRWHEDLIRDRETLDEAKKMLDSSVIKRYGMSGKQLQAQYDEKLKQVALNIFRDTDFPNINRSLLPSVEEIQAILKTDRPLLLLDALRKALCLGKNHFEAAIPSCHEERTGNFQILTPEEIRNVLHERLKLPNAQPVTVSYCAGTLTSGKWYRGLPENGPIPPGASCGTHASLVIGQRPNPKTGRCEFLIRNSWGQGCDGYSLDWSCAHGSIWVDAEVLSVNAYGYAFLE